MVDILVREVGADGWANATLFSGPLPIAAADLVAAGFTPGNVEVGAVTADGDVQTVAFTDTASGPVPAVYGAPNFDQITATSVRVLFGQTPSDNGSPLTRRDLRYSSDNGTTWTLFSPATPPQIVTGLTAQTAYLVQTRAVNDNGAAAWSPSGSFTTGQVATVPEAFDVEDWDVEDAATGGDLNATLNNLPSNGGDTITGVEYSTDGGTTPVSFGSTALTTYGFSGFTDGVEVSMIVRAVNGVGAGPWSAAKTATPTAAPATPPEIITLSALQQQTGTGNVTGAASVSEVPLDLEFVFTDSATVPTQVQIADGEDHTGSSANFSGTISVTEAALLTIPNIPANLSGTFYCHVYPTNSNGDGDTVSSLGFTIDTTPPVLSNLSAGSIAETSSTLSVQSNKSGGTIYAGVVADGATAPTAAQLIAGTGGGLVASGQDTSPTADGNNSIALSGLSAETAYDDYAVHVDEFGNVGAVLSGSGFTTTAAPQLNLQFVGSVRSDGSSSPYSFVSAGTMPANTTKAIAFLSNKAFGDPTAVTIAGQSATLVGSIENSSSRVFIYEATVTPGSALTAEATWASIANPVIDIYAANNPTFGTPVTATGTLALDVSLNVSAGNGVLAAAVYDLNADMDPPQLTMVGVTKQTDQNARDSGQDRIFVGSGIATDVTAATPRAVTITNGNSGGATLQAAAAIALEIS